MPLFRRRAGAPSPDQAAFDAVAMHVEAAQRALLAAIPTARDPGVPLAQALAAFGDELGRAQEALVRWDRSDRDRTRCADALRAAATESERLRLERGPMEFERLNARIGDVLHPLEVFADVERALRRR